MDEARHSRFNSLFQRPGAVPASLAAVITLLFADCIIGISSVIPCQTIEFFSQWLPYRLFLKASWTSGHFPLWCRNLMCGFPLAAFPHAGAFYPLNAFFLALNYARASTFFHLLHFYPMALCAYGLCREWGAGKLGSSLAALSYCLSGPVFLQMSAPHTFSALAWLPGLMWSSLVLVRRGSLLHFLASGLFFSLCYLGGDVETLLLSLLIFLAFIIFAERAAPGRIMVLVCSWGFGLLLVLAQFLSTWGYLGRSYRSSHGGYVHTMFYYRLAGVMAAAMAPDTHGFFGMSAYLGVLAPVGFLLTLFSSQRRRALMVFFVLAFLSFSFALNLWPLSRLFNALPLIGSFSASGMRFRSLYALVTLFFMLSAPGLDLAARGTGVRPGRAVLVFLSVFVLFQAAWLAAGIILGRVMPALGLERGALALFLSAAIINYALTLKHRKLFIMSPLTLVLLLAMDLFALSLFKMPRGKERDYRPADGIESPGQIEPRRMHTVSSLYPDVELWKLLRLDRGPGHLAGFIRNGLKNTQEALVEMTGGHLNYFDCNTVRPQTRGMVEFLAVDKIISGPGPLYGADPVMLDSPWVMEYYLTARGASGRTPPKTGDFYRLEPGSKWIVSLTLFPQDLLTLPYRAKPGKAPPHVTLLDMAPFGEIERFPEKYEEDAIRVEPEPGVEGVHIFPLPVKRRGKYTLVIESREPFLFTEPRITGRERPYQLQGEPDKPYRMYRSREARPFYQLHSSARPVGRGESLDEIFNKDFDPTVLLVEEDILPPDMSFAAGGAGSVSITHYSDQRSVLSIEAPGPALVSVADSHYPGWRAWVDGEEVRVLRANHAFKAVPVARAGKHTLETRFSPLDFRIGLWAGIASIACFVMAVLWALRLIRPASAFRT